MMMYLIYTLYIWILISKNSLSFLFLGTHYEILRRFIFIVYGLNLYQFHLKPYNFLSVTIHCICWLWVQLILNTSLCLQRNLVINHSNEEEPLWHRQSDRTVIQSNCKMDHRERELCHRSDNLLLEIVHNADWEHITTLKTVKLKIRS